MVHVTIKCPTENMLSTVYQIAFYLSIDQLHDTDVTNMYW